MEVEELEPGMDELCQRLIPDRMNWQGSKAEEIEKIGKIFRKITDHDLPKFYRWFLMRMGRSMGKFSYRSMDYTATTVISWYGEDFEDDGSNLFKIAHTSEPELELHMYYDINYPTRDDARVTMRQAEGGEDYRQFETFREMLATKAALIHAAESPVSCTGTLVDDDDILPQLNPVMDNLGFNKPNIPTGPRCGLYERGQGIMVTIGSMDFGLKSCGFKIGGSDSNIVRNVLGTIEEATNFLIDVKNDPRRIRDSSR